LAWKVAQQLEIIAEAGQTFAKSHSALKVHFASVVRKIMCMAWHGTARLLAWKSMSDLYCFDGLEFEAQQLASRSWSRDGRLGIRQLENPFDRFLARDEKD
jgi:hypothetical protein